MSRKLFCILFSIGTFFICLGILGAIEFILFEAQFLFCIGAIGTILTILNSSYLFYYSKIEGVNILEQDKLIREQIKNKVWEETQRKVRCVFFIARTDNNTIIYGISGNNGNLFATAEVDALGNIHLIY